MNRLDLQKDIELLVAESIIKGFENKKSDLYGKAKPIKIEAKQHFRTFLLVKKALSLIS